MNDAELDKLLKSANPPKRSSEQWIALNKRITSRLHWQPRDADHVAEPKHFGIVRWGLAIGVTCIAALLAIALWPDSRQPATAANDSSRPAEYHFAELREMFPHQIRAIVLSDTDARIDLAETADQSDTQPIYLKVCGPDGCKQVITFSGQRIRLNGDEWEVLASGPDGVIVAGADGVWTSAEPARRLSHFRIEAKQIKSS